MKSTLPFIVPGILFVSITYQWAANLKTVADAMGHASTRSTLKYLNHVQQLQDEAIDKLPSIKFHH